MPKRTWLTALLGVTAALSVAVAAATLTAFAYGNRTAPFTILAGERIGGLAAESARGAISNLATKLAERPISLVFNQTKAELSPRQLGVTINEAEAYRNAVLPSSPTEWLKPSFWRGFFGKKNLAFNYQIDEELSRRNLENALGATPTAKDAEIVHTSDGLVVTPSEDGLTFELTNIKSALETLFAHQKVPEVSVAYTVSEAQIKTEQAIRTKSEIESFIKPIRLVFENHTFTLTSNEQYGFFNFPKEGSELNWQLSKDKIRDHLLATVYRRLSIRMKPKTIMSDTGEVTFPGENGREVDLAKLTDDVHQTITEQKDALNQPVLISAKTIPFTEKIVHPGYVAGLFEGLYIDINLTLQRVYIMSGHTKLAEYLISSGKRGTPTPVGLFYIKNKIELAESRLYPGIWMQKWNALARNPDGSGYEGYGLHRVPCFNSSCTITESYSHLGRPASHGCVRIADEGADWIYGNAPVGTPVNIHT